MTINIIDYVKNNFEELLTMLISTIITISVIMQRTKLNRKVKDMQKLYEVELTVEEMELINDYRKEYGKPEETKLIEIPKIKRILDPLVPKMKTQEELEEEERLKEEEEIKDHHNFVKDYLEIYQEVKDSLNMLKRYKNKYKYNDEVEKELNENE